MPRGGGNFARPQRLHLARPRRVPDVRQDLPTPLVPPPGRLACRATALSIKDGQIDEDASGVDDPRVAVGEGRQVLGGEVRGGGGRVLRGRR